MDYKVMRPVKNPVYMVDLNLPMELRAHKKDWIDDQADK